MKTRRRYSDAQRTEALAALAANGGNVEGTARLIGIPPQDTRQLVKGVSDRSNGEPYSLG